MQDRSRRSTTRGERSENKSIDKRSKSVLLSRIRESPAKSKKTTENSALQTFDAKPESAASISRSNSQQKTIFRSNIKPKRDKNLKQHIGNSVVKYPPPPHLLSPIPIRLGNSSIKPDSRCSTPKDSPQQKCLNENLISVEYQ